MAISEPAIIIDGESFALVVNKSKPAISIAYDGINILAGARRAFGLDAYDYALVGISGNKIAVKFLSREHPQALRLCKHVSKMQICARAVRKRFKQSGPFALVATDHADTFVAEVG